MRSGQGFLLLYDVTSRASFLEIPVFRHQILSAKDADRVPLVIVGNKCDREDSRQVSAADGVALAKSYGAEFFEGSAKSGKNVDEAFYALVSGAEFCSPPLSWSLTRAYFRFAKYAQTGSEKQLHQPPANPPNLLRRSFARFCDNLKAIEKSR